MTRTSAELAAIARDGHACLRCGRTLYNTRASVHHRKKRRFQDADRVENLALMCGTGTTGCHGWCHREVEQARAAGWVCFGWENPAERPLITLTGLMIMLRPDGSKVVDRFPADLPDSPPF